ncbi:hypothetical protein LCGC14_1557420 [marine sediment metagenome]|uniref:Uncharacterized protein n=1 Tax=marine sediment metagenome TaxID=412755 RepID=A0A0F9J9I9_9ZZZZ
MNIDRKNSTDMNKRLVHALVSLGVTAQRTSKAFRDLGKTMTYMKPNICKMKWKKKTRPWR